MLRKICNVISGLLAVVLLALAGVLIVPYLMGYTELAVLTGSMQPTLPVGTLIYVKEVEPETLQVGDVVTYRLEGETMVTHRVVENNTLMGQFVTKGDANEKADVNPASYEEFIGKLALSIPYLGRLAQLFTSTSGKIGAGIVILAALLLHVIGTTFEKRTEKSQQKRS